MNIPSTAYLECITPALGQVVERPVRRQAHDDQIDTFARSFISKIVRHGALIPPYEDPAEVLELALTQHIRNPEQPVAWFNLAVILRVLALSCTNEGKKRNNHRLALASDACIKSLRLANSIRTWIELGIILQILDQKAEALSAFEQCLVVQPNDVSGLIWKAFALDSLDRHEEAITAFREARVNCPQQVNASELDHVFEEGNDEIALHAMKLMLRKLIRY